jgi:hypothetical protein
MGAGGDWDYTAGIDHIKKHPDHAVTAPQGLRQYNPKTNKPMQTKPRDGDWYNLKWDNIKPDHADHTTISTSCIPHDPTAPERPMHTIRRNYSYQRNIEKIYTAYDRMNPRYTVKHMGNEPFMGWTYEDAQQEFDRRLANMKGVKQRLRSGDIMVTSTVRLKR